jgi:hypothetical protein
MRLRATVLEEMIQGKLEQESASRRSSQGQRQLELRRFGEAFVRRWTARTTCQAEYLVPICRHYEPPKVPSGLVPPAVPLTRMAAAAG